MARPKRRTLRLLGGEHQEESSVGKSCQRSCLTDVDCAAGSPIFMPHAWPPHCPEEDAYRRSPVPMFRGWIDSVSAAPNRCPPPLARLCGLACQRETVCRPAPRADASSNRCDSSSFQPGSRIFRSGQWIRGQGLRGGLTSWRDGTEQWRLGGLFDQKAQLTTTYEVAVLIPSNRGSHPQPV